MRSTETLSEYHPTVKARTGQEEGTVTLSLIDRATRVTSSTVELQDYPAAISAFRAAGPGYDARIETQTWSELILSL